MESQRLREPRVETMLYFSYGSNMSSRRLLSRVPAAEYITTAALHGHELIFHKRSRDGSAKCDAFETKSDRQVVMGVVYEISKEDRAVLDRIEGLGKGYEVKGVELITPQERTMAAYTYYATSIDNTLQPFHWYKHHVMAGALEYRLPLTYIDSLQRVASREDPDPQRHALEMAIYEEPALCLSHG
ncbi:MAG: gamma-glutamylcyclotransferase family protein [Candidatus Thiodiazotropha sp.]